MSIRPSSAADVTRLVEELTAGDVQRRELAGARLAVIGARATSALLVVAGDPSRNTAARVTALETLEAIGDGRAAPLAHSLVAAAQNDPQNDPQNEAFAIAAIGVLGQVARGKDVRATRAFDRLAALVVASGAPTALRLAALSALDGQPERLLKPLYEALARDPASRVVARVTRRQAGAVEPLETLVERGLPQDPDVMVAVARDDGERTSLTTLKRAVEAIRARERRVAREDERARWTVARGVLHQHLAARGSRLALYDLRETLEQATGPLPVGFLSAAAVIGDLSCLTPLARIWVEAPPDDRWWREHLAEAFGAIVAREQVRRRHPTLRKILERWPASGVLVAMARR